MTPSAIYVDKRGKRFMGTSTKFKLGGEELTPEECSAEILRELFKNLPDEIRVE